VSKVVLLPFLNRDEKGLFWQVQGRIYANMFALVERPVRAKSLEISGGQGLGDQVALEALVRLIDEGLKHQQMFRRLEAMLAPSMPAGSRSTTRCTAAIPQGDPRPTGSLMERPVGVKASAGSNGSPSAGPTRDLTAGRLTFKLSNRKADARGRQRSTPRGHWLS
jgi:hypothetical protein